MPGMAPQMGFSSTRRVCSGKEGERGCLLGGWVSWFLLLARLNIFIEVELGPADWYSGSLRLVAWGSAAFLGVFFGADGDSEQLCAGAVVSGCCLGCLGWGKLEGGMEEACCWVRQERGMIGSILSV